MHVHPDQPHLSPSHHTFVVYLLQWINKILYRSRQRGFLELDLLVGLWAEQHVPQMDMHMLQQFSLLLEQVCV
jgi:succinate dehydrogenase flavin-adding protein (antitoxin of CptAB toxin-antitoxin module)